MTALIGAGDRIEEEIPDGLFEELPVDAQPVAAANDALARLPVFAPANEPLPSFVAPLPAVAPAEAPSPEEALFATLPKLPSIQGFAMKLEAIQLSLMEAQAEADSLRTEIQRKADALRKLAVALEATI